MLLRSEEVESTSRFLWEMYTTSEDDYVEYCRCFAELERLGLDKMEIKAIALNCIKCPLRGRCNVSNENMFVGAKTC